MGIIISRPAVCAAKAAEMEEGEVAVASLRVLLVPKKNATSNDSLTPECCLHLLAKPLLGSFQCCDLSPTCEAHRTLGPESLVAKSLSLWSSHPASQTNGVIIKVP